MSGKGMKPKSGYNNKLYCDNYDSIFHKEKQPSEWLKEPEFRSIKVVNASGWKDYDDFCKPINKDTFIFKLAKSEFIEENH